MAKWFELTDEEDRAIAAFMARVASLPAAPAMTDPMPLWWKAQLVRRWDAERRAQAPLDVMERMESWPASPRPACCSCGPSRPWGRSLPSHGSHCWVDSTFGARVLPLVNQERFQGAHPWFAAFCSAV